MNRLNVFLANSNGNLNKVEKLIKEAVIDAESYVFPKFGINWNIDLMITNRMAFRTNTGRWGRWSYILERPDYRLY